MKIRMFDDEIRMYIDGYFPETVNNLPFKDLKDILYSTLGNANKDTRDRAMSFIDGLSTKNNLLLNELVKEYGIPNNFIPKLPINDAEKIQSIKTMQRIKNVITVTNMHAFFLEVYQIEFTVLSYMNDYSNWAQPIMRPIARPSVTSQNAKRWVVSIRIDSNPLLVSLDIIKNIFVELFVAGTKVNLY